MKYFLWLLFFMFGGDLFRWITHRWCPPVYYAFEETTDWIAKHLDRLFDWIAEQVGK